MNVCQDIDLCPGYETQFLGGLERSGNLNTIIFLWQSYSKLHLRLSVTYSRRRDFLGCLLR